MKKYLKNTFAILCFAVGIIGGFIPVLQGWVFILLGYSLLDFPKKEQLEKQLIAWMLTRTWTKKTALFWIKMKDKYQNKIKRKNGTIRHI